MNWNLINGILRPTKHEKIKIVISIPIYIDVWIPVEIDQYLITSK